MTINSKPVETRTAVNNATSGVLGGLKDLAGLYLGFKTAEAQTKAAIANTGANPPPAAGTTGMDAGTRQLLLWGGIGFAALLVVGLIFRRR